MLRHFMSHKFTFVCYDLNSLPTTHNFIVATLYNKIVPTDLLLIKSCFLAVAFIHVAYEQYNCIELFQYIDVLNKIDI